VTELLAPSGTVVDVGATTMLGMALTEKVALMAAPLVILTVVEAELAEAMEGPPETALHPLNE
jgi:hypothetical protein